MATSVDFKKDFLTCTICYDLYTKPTSLPCLHTFCRRCLSSYIVAEDDNYGVRRKQAFPCPVCRAIARPPVPSKPLSLWAADFKTNFYIESLMSALKVNGNKQEQTTQFEKMLQSAQEDSSDSMFRKNIPPPPSYLSIESQSDWYPASTSIPLTRTSPRIEDSVHIKTLPAPQTGKSYELLKYLSASMPGDKGESRLYGICLVQDIIVALDFENHRIKSFFNWRAVLEVNVVTKSLALGATPRSMTKISDTAVAVTVPSRREIYLVQVKPILKTISVVTTARGYKTIAESGSGYLIATDSRLDQYPQLCSISSIYTVNYDGITLKSTELSPELSGLRFDSISVSNSGLVHLVRSSSSHSLLCITQDGDELYRYEPNEEEKFQSLGGLCCRFGDVYLTDFESNSIIEIKCDCGLPASRETILSSKHGIQKPTDVYVEPDGTIFVACWDGFVRVYTLKERPSILKNRKLEETEV